MFPRHSIVHSWGSMWLLRSKKTNLPPHKKLMGRLDLHCLPLLFHRPLLWITAVSVALVRHPKDVSSPHAQLLQKFFVGSIPFSLHHSSSKDFLKTRLCLPAPLVYVFFRSLHPNSPFPFSCKRSQHWCPPYCIRTFLSPLTFILPSPSLPPFLFFIFKFLPFEAGSQHGPG